MVFRIKKEVISLYFFSFGSSLIIGNKHAVFIEIAVNPLEFIHCFKRFPWATLFENAFLPLFLQHLDMHSDELQNLPNFKSFLLIYFQSLVDKSILSLFVFLFDNEEWIFLEHGFILSNDFPSILVDLLNVVLVFV